MKKILIVSLASIALMCASCSILSDVASQVQGLANLANCEFNLKNVSNLSVAGVNVKDITNGNISAIDVVKLTSALVSKNVPLNMDVNVNVKNPTDKNAVLSAMDWALDIQKSQYATGTLNKRYNIVANKTSIVPLNVGTDLYSLFSKKGAEDLKKFASSFSSNGLSSDLDLRIKPSLEVAGQTIKYPNFINITKK